MESNNSYNSKAYENLKSLDCILYQLCDITNSKHSDWDYNLFDHLPNDIDMDEFTRVYSKRIMAQIDVIKRGKKIMYVL